MLTRHRGRLGGRPLIARNFDIGGFPFIVFFQMDKNGHGLRRVQIERPRSGAVPVVYRAVLRALTEVYGAPSESCERLALDVGERTVHQQIWHYGGAEVRVVFFEQSFNTIEPALDEAYGYTQGPRIAGTSQQLLVRIAPDGMEPDDCRRR